jgi:hypothetical protein
VFLAAHTLGIVTHGDPLVHPLWVTTFDAQSFKFRVQACSDVYVYLPQFYHDTSQFAYQLILGAMKNTK